jgi:hypothetical protein
VCAAVACRADELVAACQPFTLGRWARHLEVEAGDRLGVARLEKLEQALAAESDSGLLVQPAWIEKNVPDFCATNSLVRKMPAYI